MNKNSVQELSSSTSEILSKIRFELSNKILNDSNIKDESNNIGIFNNIYIL